MKKIFFGLLMAALTLSLSNAVAQSAPLKTKTITAADTVTVLNVGSNVVSAQYTYTETSGTTAGKIYLEVTNDASGAWFKVDSVSLADVTTKQGLKTNFTVTNFLHLRWINTNTSSATGAVRYVVLRRPDEQK